jgi:hypothetical protein
VPPGFFGIAPQTELTEQDAHRMAAGGLESIRVPIDWGTVQPTRKGTYNWAGIDQIVEVAARSGLRVLPFLYGTPHWLGKPTTLPVANSTARAAWVAFVKAAVERYKPGGEFWKAHKVVGINYEPIIKKALPIRTWQIWNEANFYYFAYPVSPFTYAKLVKLSSRAIKGVDPGAQVLLSGLFGEPTKGGTRGMPAAEFLSDIYQVPGIKSYFDGIALHPYAVDSETLEEIVEAVHEVTVAAADRPAFYITEMGWGSQNDPEQVAFEQGPAGQAIQLRDSYDYLLENRSRLNLKGVYWFSWKDVTGSCSFCDSVGLFGPGKGFHPKRAWHTFTGITRRYN